MFYLDFFFFPEELENVESILRDLSHWPYFQQRKNQNEKITNFNHFH